MNSGNVFYYSLENNYKKIYKDILATIKKQYGWNLNHIKLKIFDKCVDVNNNINTQKKSVKCPGSYTKKNIIYIGSLDHLKKVKRYFKINIDTHKFLRQMIVHELMHEVYNKILSKKERKWFDDMLLQGGFTTPYLEKIKNSKEEKFCEYIAHSLYG